MARDRILQIYRGTTAQNDAFTGAAGELTMDTSRKEIRIHDGSTAGGNPIGLTPGFIAPFAGTSVPEGWLLCDGSAVSRTTYAKLFAVIGTTYGAGDGNSTFNLPDFKYKSFYMQDGGHIGASLAGQIPNITGTWDLRAEGNYTAAGQNYSGALQPRGNASNQVRPSSSGRGTWDYGIYFNARAVSTVYTDGETGVVPRSITTNFVIKY